MNKLNLDLQSIKKSDNRKDISIAFLTKLNKIEEVEESEKKMRKSLERPKSATFLASVKAFEKDVKKRPKSSETVCVRTGKRKKPFEIREYCCCCCRREAKCECVSLLNFDSRSSSNLDAFAGELRTSYKFHTRRKCKSEPCFQKCISERELCKVKRSLRLLGFELSDFGIYLDRGEKVAKGKPRRSPSFSTIITNRSVSLESLRATIKRAWMDDSLDESHRKILSQAAYEEWYFKKEREMWKKREEEKIQRLKAEENLRDDSRKKKIKSEEEFQKWLHRKRVKRKEKKENFKHPFSFSKTKEESEQAFIKWKKAKEKELEKKKKEKKNEEERRKASEKQKIEKKIIAEKAFQQWKAKLEETKKLEVAKRERKKKNHEEEVQKLKKEESRISFQMWKAAKDEEIKEKIKQIREAERTAREERIQQMEERMYEAEQAFEDWLEKVDLRKRKFSGANVYQKVIPWIPA